MRKRLRIPRGLPHFALFILQFSLFTLPAHGGGSKDFDREIARQKKELVELHDRLQAEQKELDQLREKKESTLGTLDKITGNIRHTEAYLNQLDVTEETLNKSLDAVRGEMAEVEVRIQERNGVMAKRVRTLFMTGGPDRMVLKGWESGRGDFMRKVFFMKRVLRYDRALVEAGREDAALKQRAAEKLNARLAELEGFRAHKAKEKETYSRARKEQEKLERRGKSLVQRQ